MSQPSGGPDTLSPDDALPPVEPPSAGFILQLFVVPAAIVGLIVLVWLLFTWLAQMGANPQKYLDGLSRDNEARWQSAAALADVLNGPGNAELKRDEKFAGKLAAILDSELNSGELDDKHGDVSLRLFLCRALGEFYVPDVAPVLVRACDRKDPREIAARRAALEALAVLASNVPEVRDAPSKELLNALSTAAEDDEPVIRSSAAFALGVFPARAANRQLAAMLNDADADVRYNAATALARHGDAQAIPALCEMLELTPEDVTVNEAEIMKDTENKEQAEANVKLARQSKHALIIANALRAARELHARNQTVDLAPLLAAVGRLTGDDVPAEIRYQAIQTERELQTRPERVQAER